MKDGRFKSCTHEEFLNKLFIRNKHYRTGSFKLIGKYINSTTKLLVTDKYGDLLIRPQTLLQGANTQITSAINKTQYFINKAKEVHGDLFDYSKTTINKLSEKSTFICKIHGEFIQTGQGHINGRGCYRCSKTFKNHLPVEWAKSSKISKNFKSFNLYIVRCWNETENFFKIGKTFLDISDRFNGKRRMPYEYEVYSLIKFKTAEECSIAEKELHTIYKQNKYKPLKKFGGMYECFSKI